MIYILAVAAAVVLARFVFARANASEPTSGPTWASFARGL